MSILKNHVNLYLKTTESNRPLSRQRKHRLPIHNATTHISNQPFQHHTIPQSDRRDRKTHLLRLVLTIDSDNDRLFLELAREDVCIIIKIEIDQTPRTQRRMLAP